MRFSEGFTFPCQRLTEEIRYSYINKLNYQGVQYSIVYASINFNSALLSLFTVSPPTPPPPPRAEPWTLAHFEHKLVNPHGGGGGKG